MEDNRINFAKYQIFCYVTESFLCISELINPDFEESMNMNFHKLSEKELVLLLYQLFSDYMLVAKSESRNFFTPSLEEIELALKENNDFMYRSSNTFYGLTTGAMELFTELQKLYQKK